MPDTVVVVGSGINAGIKEFRDDLEMPRAASFMRQALSFFWFRKGPEHPWARRTAPLLAYIERYWGLSMERLREVDFDLEECFTLISLQRRDAKRLGDEATERTLSDVDDALKALLGSFLDRFTGTRWMTDDFHALATYVLKEKASVITFNYDTLLEEMLELASGRSSQTPPYMHPDEIIAERQAIHAHTVRDEELRYAEWNWDRTASYGVEFDAVDLDTPNGYGWVRGPRLYRARPLSNPPFLKLHGSLNWFQVTDEHVGPDRHFRALEGPRPGDAVIMRGDRSFGERIQVEGYYVDQLMVPPVIYKDEELSHGGDVFHRVWSRALAELQECRRIVIAGYSFPPTDFHVRRLFLEAFADRQAPELIVINPDDEAAKRAARYSRAGEEYQRYRTLDEFATVTGLKQDWWTVRE